MEVALRGKSEIDLLLEEFRRIGRDSEYCPESEEVYLDEPVPKNEMYLFQEYYAILEAQWIALVQSISQQTNTVFYSQPVRDSCLICTFCRKNGEAYAFYKSHRLRDEFDRICCPVLRRYQCPICNATGDDAHTRKYCPFNKDPTNVPLITRLKGLRNSMGRRRKEN